MSKRDPLKLNLFFDESGKANETIKLMGSLMIPDTIYNHLLFQKMNQHLKEKTYKIHFTDYSKGSKEEKKIFLEIISALAKFQPLWKFNAILYGYPPDVDKQRMNTMITSKLPVRVLYGLLRDFPQHIPIQATVYIEAANEYRINEKRT
ncbi:MAG: hypothetical protein ACRC5C_01345 [Bacilli bacterium]